MLGFECFPVMFPLLSRRIVLCLGYCYFATGIKLHGFYFFLMWNHWEQLVSEYKKAPALMMTGKSSLWDLGAKGREQMGTACRDSAWNPSGEPGFQIIASAFVNVSGDELGAAAPSFLGKAAVSREKRLGGVKREKGETPGV